MLIDQRLLTSLHEPPEEERVERYGYLGMGRPQRRAGLLVGRNVPHPPVEHFFLSEVGCGAIAASHASSMKSHGRVPALFKISDSSES